MSISMTGEVIDAKDFSSLKEFLMMFERTTEEGRQSTLNMLDLLNQLRAY